MSESVEVRVGQVWADCDPRSEGRQVQILMLASPYAIVVSPTGRGRRTRIRLDRFRPVRSGYRLVRDAPASPVQPPRGGDTA